MNLLVRRAFAYIFDFCLLLLLTTIFVFSANVFSMSAETANQSNYMIASMFATNIILTSYIPTKTNGSTIGKMIFKVKVTNLNGKPINYWQSFLREGILKFAFVAFFIPMTVIYCIMVSVPQRRLVLVFAHDVLLKTEVTIRR